MALKERESIIQQIVDESRLNLKPAGRQQILVKWRSMLEKDPPYLKPYQIDEIVRAVRGRLDPASS